MRVGVQHRRDPVETNLRQELGDPVVDRRAVCLLAGGVRGEDLAQLRADLQRRVQSAGRILRDIRHRRAPHPPQLRAITADHLLTSEPHAATVDLQTTPRVAHQRQGDGRLARAGLADQAQHLTRADRERHIIDDIRLRPRDHDPQPVDDQQLSDPAAGSFRPPVAARGSWPVTGFGSWPVTGCSSWPVAGCGSWSVMRCGPGSARSRPPSPRRGGQRRARRGRSRR